MVRILMAVFVGANFVAMIFLTWMPSFLYRKFGMSLSMAGLNGTAYLQVASVLGVITGGCSPTEWRSGSAAGGCGFNPSASWRACRSFFSPAGHFRCRC